MDTPTEPLRNHRCPICGGPNACAAAAAGRFDVPCWCASVRFPATVLAQVPEAGRGRACVCRACVERIGATGAAPRQADLRPERSSTDEGLR